jgi:hypothetical protein
MNAGIGSSSGTEEREERGEELAERGDDMVVRLCGTVCLPQKDGYG